FEYIVTENEIEALILECNLIKLHRPKYNVRLKDDKSYPYIKVTVNERFPRLLFSRKRGKDKAQYFGPYTSADRVREILDLIHRIWPLRQCGLVFPRDFDKARPCLNYHIGRCKAPCNRMISEDEYKRYLAEAERFIHGKTSEVAAKLSREMQGCAEELQFERAAELRDTIELLRVLSEKQKADACDGDDRDIIALARAKKDAPGEGVSESGEASPAKPDEALVQVFFVRGGKMTGREHFMMTLTDAADASDSEIYAAFIKQFYGEAAFIPRELVIAAEPAESAEISAWLRQVKGRSVVLTVPRKGEKRELVQLALNNAALTMEQFGAHIRNEAERNKQALSEISRALATGAPLTRIEAYDISNIQGFESVGSMIVFENGKAKHSDYRKFKIKGVRGPDDYASMEEVITRRFTRYLNEKAEGGDAGKFSRLPELLMIDGGKGQVSAAEKALAALNMRVPVCGMVKDDRHRTRGLMYDGREIPFDTHGEGFKLITRIQDEVHRFAVEYHRKLRADTQIRSVLDEIPGVGPTRRKALMREYKNIEAIRSADVESLSGVPSMNKKSAEAVYAYFHKELGSLNS
ncbi:MAG: excinuclease ABC subunit UvrC, partial [Clostridiales bacterium]|nr:excinuclease ABC subunit UvrC [Clostridiales bacterium]